jgi:hypothetical protein
LKIKQGESKDEKRTAVTGVGKHMTERWWSHERIADKNKEAMPNITSYS